MESSDIELFIQRAELLKQCSFFNSGNKISSNFNYKKGEDVKISTVTPPRESIESLGMRVRIFIVQDEPLYFDKFVRKLIKIDLENEVKYQEYLRVFEDISTSSAMVIREERDGKTIEYSALDFMWDQLYGEYFHLDKKKRERNKHFKSFLGGIPETMALAKLEQFAKLIIHLSIFLTKNNIAQKVSTS